MMIRSFDVLSMAKMQALLGVVFGFLIGGFFTLLSLAGLAAGGGRGGPEAILFGVGAIIIFPLVYSIFGFIGGAISALVYNLLASVVGGVIIHFDQVSGEE